MARKIKVMISSRCSDLVSIGTKTISYTDLRKYLLEELEKEQMLNQDLFDVVISEYIVEPAGETSWNTCIKEIVDSDIVLVWFTGHEGYKDPGKSIGICYAEYIEAIQSNPSKVFILDFRKLKLLYADKNEIPNAVKKDSDFAKEIIRRDKWLQRVELDKCKTLDDLKSEVLRKSYELIFAAVTNFIISGSTTLRQTTHVFGEGLLWNKLNYTFRQQTIKYYVEKTVNKFIVEEDFKLLKNTFISHAIPDAMSVVEAREMVGRPFLNDLEHLPKVNIGPIHIIGVYKNATERQLRDVIGHQDVAIIQEDFGFYVWDLVNHIQLVYIINCKDPEVTTLQTQAFFTWLRVQDETQWIIDRARRRKEILKTIDHQKVVLTGNLK